MNFRSVQLILKREYLQRVRSPGFIIGTIVGVLGLAALAFLPSVINALDQQTASRIAVADPNNLVFDYLPVQEGPAPTPQPGSQQSSLPTGAPIQFSRASSDDLVALDEHMRRGALDGYIVVAGERPNNATFTYFGKDRPGSATSAQLNAQLTSALLQARLNELGITPQQAQVLFAPPILKVEAISGSTLKDEKVFFQSVALVYVLLILLYITILMYGIQVAMSVVEEKSSRVMEMLITAVRPFELMLGKVVGVGLAGLTQYGLWVTAGLLGLVISSALSGSGSLAGVDVAAVPATTLLSFLVFFVLGYLLFAAMYAALGSLVNRTEDVNSVTGPLTIVMVVVYLVSIYALGNPDAVYVRWLSFIPFFTPMLMFIRVALGNTTWWEVLVAIFLLAVAGLLLTWIAAKIYRVGVLLYGKRPSFREISRLLRAA